VAGHGDATRPQGPPRPLCLIVTVRAERRTDATTTLFVIAELDPKLDGAVRELEFQPVDGGFARRFPADARERAQRVD
jgi:hypothetical protein